MIFYILIIFFVIINLCLFLNIEKIAKLVNIYDFPDNDRKFHSKVVPILGGLFIWVNILFCFFLFNSNFLLNYKSLISINIFFGLSFLFFLGLYDDKKNLSPNKKLILLIFFVSFFLQFEQKLILSEFFFVYKNFSLIISNKYLAYCLTILCILLLINASNMFDGVNFQCGFFYLIVFLILYLKKFDSLFLIILIICLIFFLLWNIRSKVFFGDGGTNLLSFIAAFYLIHFHNIEKAIYADEIFLILATPGIDMFRVFVFRIINKQNPFFPDRIHIHHLLENHFSLVFSQFLIFCNILLPILLFYFFNLNIMLCIILNIFFYSLLLIFVYKKTSFLMRK